MNRSTYALGALTCAALLCVPVQAQADGIPQDDTLFYTGVLETNAGNVVTGDYIISVKLFSDGSGGTELCQTTPSGSTSVVSGRFRIALSSNCVDAVSNNSNVWVEVSVDGGVLGRAKLGAVPYAVESANAQMCRAVEVGAIDDASISSTANISPAKIAGTAATLTGDQSFDNGVLFIDATNDRVGVGTDTPTMMLDVAGPARIEGRRVPFAVVADVCASSSCTATCPAGTTVAMAFGFHGFDGNTSDSHAWACGGAWEWAGSCLGQSSCTIATQCSSSSVRLHCW